MELHGGRLFGRIDYSLKEALAVEETEALRDWLTGQCSDGLGEGFEQQPIDTMDGELFVSFWNSVDDYAMMTEDEFEEHLQNTEMTMGGMQYMALLLSAVTVTAGYDEAEFTVGGIPREYDELAGKIYLTEDEVKNVQKAIHSFKMAAANGNDYAEYQLGKIYLYGKDAPRDTDTAMYDLHLVADHGNNYAAQLIHSIRANGNFAAVLASLRLLGHTVRIIQNRLEDEHKGRENRA